VEENNVQTGMAEGTPNFDGHPTQAHADHATIMKAHGIIGNPERMNAVHALHAQGGGLINFLKKKQKDFATKQSQQMGGAEAPAHEESAGGDKDSDMTPNPVSQMGNKKSAETA
jgi:hypothetical protein